MDVGAGGEGVFGGEDGEAEGVVFIVGEGFLIKGDAVEVVGVVGVDGFRGGAVDGDRGLAGVGG